MLLPLLLLYAVRADAGVQQGRASCCGASAGTPLVMEARGVAAAAAAVEMQMLGGSSTITAAAKAAPAGAKPLLPQLAGSLLASAGWLVGFAAMSGI
jgi:hypothetical protein